MVYLFWAATRGRCFTASVASRKQRSRFKLVASLDNKFPMSSTVAQIFRAVHLEQLSLELNLDPKQNQIRQLSDSRGPEMEIYLQLLVAVIYIHYHCERKKLMTCSYLQHGRNIASPARAKGVLPCEDSAHVMTPTTTPIIALTCPAFYIVFNPKKINEPFCFIYSVACRGAVPVVLHHQKLRLLSLLRRPRARKVN